MRRVLFRIWSALKMKEYRISSNNLCTMAENETNVVKLGLFVISALFLLILSLYLIGKSKNLLGSTVQIKSKFKNVNGLRIGSNVYFSGVQAGTVKDIKLLNATTVE